MKVLVVSECYPTDKKPQYGIFIKQQVDALRAHGVTVDVLLPENNGINTDYEYVDDKIGGYYKISYKIGAYDFFHRIYGGKFRANSEKFIRTNGYDIVIIHIVGEFVLANMISVAKKCGVKPVAYYHGLNVWEEYTTKHKLLQKFYALRRSISLKKCSAIIGVSKKVTDILGQRIKNTRIETVYNGVDLSLFYPEKKDKSAEYKIISVGNLIEIKGFEYLLEGFSELYREKPSVSLSIVGGGKERDRLKALAETLGVTEAVEFCGVLPYQSVAQKMRESDAFILASFYEALGCVYLEAMGCGLPTVGVSGMGIDEVIDDGENGLLIRPKNSSDVYAALEKLCNTPKLAEKIGEAGRQSALGFTWNKNAEKLIEVLKELK